MNTKDVLMLVKEITAYGKLRAAGMSESATIKLATIQSWLNDYKNPEPDKWIDSPVMGKRVVPQDDPELMAWRENITHRVLWLESKMRTVLRNQPE